MGLTPLLKVGPGPLKCFPAQVQHVVTRYLDAVDATCPGLVEALYLVGG
jgi:hypothetical protein